MKSLNAEMDEAIVEIGRANERLAAAKVRTAAARSDECTCLNHVNLAQKRVDELVGVLKKQAPRDSDWNRPLGFPCPPAP